MPSWSAGGKSSPSQEGGEGEGSGDADADAGEDGDERDKAEEDVQEEASFTLADEAKLRSLHSTIALLLIHERMERRQQSQGAAALIRTTSSAHLRPPRLCPRFDARALRRS